MSLRDEIENYLMDTDADLETGSGLMVAADAILVLVRAHLTSDAAVERAVHKTRVVGILPGRSDAEVMRLALIAALEKGK